MLLDLGFMIWQVLTRLKNFLTSNILTFSAILCVASSLRCKEAEITQSCLYLFRGTWRILAAMAIVMFDFTLYLHFYWSKEDLLKLRMRGPKTNSDRIVYGYLRTVEKTCRLFRNTKDALIATEDPYRWGEVEASFLRKTEQRGSTSLKYDRKLAVKFLWSMGVRKSMFWKKFNSTTKSWKQKLTASKQSVEDIGFVKRFRDNIPCLMETPLIENCRAKVGFLKNYIKETLSRLAEGEHSIPHSIGFLMELALVEKLRSVKKIRIRPILKMMLYEVFPLTVSILLVWNTAVLVLYQFDERIIDTMQPYPDWRILVGIVSLPVTLSALLHRIRTKEDLHEYRFLGRFGYLNNFIVYYSPIDDMLYGVFVACNGILFPPGMFEIE